MNDDNASREAAIKKRSREGTYKMANGLWRGGGDYRNNAISIIRRELYNWDDKLLSFVADILGEMIVRPEPKGRGRPTKKQPKCDDEIRRAYTDVASVKLGAGINPFTPTLQEVVEKLKEFKVCVVSSRIGGQTAVPAGWATVSQTIVEQRLSKFRKQDVEDPELWRQVYLWNYAKITGQEKEELLLCHALSILTLSRLASRLDHSKTQNANRK